MTNEGASAITVRTMAVSCGSQLCSVRVLATSDAFTKLNVPPDGVLQGTYSSEEGSGGARDVTYNWRFMPDP